MVFIVEESDHYMETHEKKGMADLKTHAEQAGRDQTSTAVRGHANTDL